MFSNCHMVDTKKVTIVTNSSVSDAVRWEGKTLFQDQTDLVPMWLTSCVTLDKRPNLSEPQFTHLTKEENSSSL